MARTLTPFLLMAAIATALAADQPQWGQRYTRNMISDARGVPDAFEPGTVGPDGLIQPGTTRGVKWTARLGANTNGTPVIAGGKVFVGTNNRFPRDKRHQGDRGVLMCFNEADGRFLWQLVVPKLTAIKWSDWHYVGICSSATVEGSRAYIVTNRCEIVCLDTEGMANGNDGPYRDEGAHIAPRGKAPLKPQPADADIIWLYDMVKELGVTPHNASNCSILMHGDLLYVCTSNGVDWTHKKIVSPKAPSLIVIDKKSGRLVAKDNAGIGPDIFHGEWSSPSYGKVGGRPLVFLGGGNGLCYAFEALRSPADQPVALKTVWSFKCDTAGRKVPGGASVSPPDPNGPSVIIGMPVFHNNRVYVAAGGDAWHGKRAGGLYCIDASKTGDITTTGRLWAYEKLGQSISTVSIGGGLVYVAAFDGKVHCLDAETGKRHWVHDTRRNIYGSTLLVDGKLYVGTTGGDLWVLAAGKEKRVISRIRLSSPIHTTPVVANGVLYVAANRHLYAINGKDE